MGTLMKTLQEHVELHRDIVSGIAWIEDGRSGCGHSCHANIFSTGSVAGMKSRGYWRKSDRTAQVRHIIYNIDLLSIHGIYDFIAYRACLCDACRPRRANDVVVDIALGKSVYFVTDGFAVAGEGTIREASAKLYRIDITHLHIGKMKKPSITISKNLVIRAH